MIPMMPSAPAAPGLELFDQAAAAARVAELRRTLEWRLITEVAADCFKEAPSEPVWQWAARSVWLDEIMSSEPGWYDPRKTPWTKELQEIPVSRPDVRVVAVKKSSRSGFSEAAFNILRWMPDHWPGNAGLVFPEDKQGRDVVKRRLMDSLKRVAGKYFTGDDNDEGLSAIKLRNMVIKMGPSGAARMFTEWWVRYFVLDELEEHDASDTTTTVERALSRQTDVADALCLLISKPKRAGGPIDDWFIKGTQKLWSMPCPRCERGIVFDRRHFTNPDECRKSDGTWDLELVERNTFALCPHCKGKIEEREKREMNEAALWVPTAEQHRRRGVDGKPVPAVPGVESYQISDYPSYHPKVSWGKLRVLALMAFEVQPTRKAQVHYLNNHEGEAEEPAFVGTDTATVEALKAGRVEQRRITLPDGSEVEQSVTLGLPGGYRLAFRGGIFSSALPYRPDILLCFADKQQTHLKYAVFALRVDPALPGQCEAHLVEVGRADDETELERAVILRAFPVADGGEPVRITAGFIDSRYRGQAVFDFCLRLYHQHGLQIWPVRGEGREEGKSRGKAGTDADARSKANLRGKILRFVEQFATTGRIMVRYFKDHDLQDMLNEKIAERAGWRMWLPTDYPAEFAAELIAEKYDPATDTWVHNKQRFGPNDWRDCCKYLVLWVFEHLAALLQQKGLAVYEPAAPPAAEEAEPAEPAPQGRDYVLRRPGGPD
jgi:hypothetical protein